MNRRVLMNEPNPPEPNLRDEALTTRGVVQTVCVIFFIGFAISAGVVIALLFFKSLVEM